MKRNGKAMGRKAAKMERQKDKAIGFLCEIDEWALPKIKDSKPSSPNDIYSIHTSTQYNPFASTFIHAIDTIRREAERHRSMPFCEY